MAVEIRTTDKFAEILKKAIEARVSEIIHQEAQQATLVVSKRVRDLLPSICVAVFSKYSMQMDGENLHITINLSNFNIEHK